MVRPKVLLIDPDIAVRKELEVTLKGEFDMWATEDPATAATLCLEWQPDVIVFGAWTASSAG